MFKNNKTQSINRTLRISIFATILVFSLLIIIHTIIAYNNFKTATKKMRNNYTKQQKTAAKDRVMSIVNMINYYTSTGKQQAMKKVKQRTYEAYAIASSIYEQNKNSLSKDKIAKLIKDALRPIRFQNGSGYYFATNLNGTEELFAIKPELEGKNLIDFKDINGTHVIKEMITLIKNKKEGFYSYYWIKPGYKNKKFLKISYIKLFKPLNWFIGTGLYVNDVEQEIKRNILNKIDKIKFTKGRCIFINTYDGYALLSNAKIVNSKKKLWEINPHTKSVFEKELNAVKNGGGFIRYKWPKMGNPHKMADKISYVYGIDKWQWIVGSGVYVKDIEQTISAMRKELKNQMKRQIIIVVFVIAIAAFILMFVVHKTNNRLSKDVDTIISFFEKAALKNKKIDLNDIKFKEFKRMAKSVNEMIDTKIEMQNIYEDEFIKSFVHIMEARDIYTKGHSQRVAFYALKIAETLNLSSKEKEDIYRAGLLHDIGKIGIPDNILLKPGTLTQSEYNIIKYHSIFSYEILSRLKHFKHLADCVRQHHERCDGSGYPDGLNCDKITLCAKILAIADIFDALTTTRPYRKAFGIQKAIDILKTEKIDQEIFQKVKETLINSFKEESDTEIIFMSEEINKVRDEIFNVDYMTGLKRKKTIPEKAKTLVENRIPFALFMIDIKNISQINYKYSIEIGDKLIIYSADACRDFLSKNGYDNTDSLARAYNDAFLFIHKLTKETEEDLNNMSKSIKNILKELVAKRFKDDNIKDIYNQIDFYVTYAIFPKESEDINKLMLLCSIKKSKEENSGKKTTFN